MSNTLPTLEEFGKRLPIGHVDESGARHGTFELRDWDWELEEKIGASIEASEGSDATFGQYISSIMAEVVKSVGTIDFDSLKHVQRLGTISRMYYPDVLYMYVWARIDGLGHALKLKPFKCKNPKCKKQIDFVGDLRQIEVQAVDPKDLEKTVQLEHGVTYADKVRKSATVSTLRWSFFEDQGFAAAMSNPAKMYLLTLQGGVVEVEGAPKPAHLTREHLKTMRRPDILKLFREINDVGGGPVMEIEGECPHCNGRFEETIDWTYADFFGRSVP